MTSLQEKPVLVHWYYSVSEWEHFVRSQHKRNFLPVLLQLLLSGLLPLLLLRFFLRSSWWLAIMISMAIVILFVITDYYWRRQLLRWKAHRMPEVEITDYMAMINDRMVIFYGKGRLLRKVDIKEDHAINILEIVYEYKTGEEVGFDELRIPVPRGRLREAVEVQHCLNLRRDMLSLLE